MAHGLRTLVIMLRLKGEREDDTLREDEGRPRLVDVEETDELTGKDVFPVDESDGAGYLEYDSGRPGRTLPLRGFAIAAAAFTPTFLLIFFGLPYLVGSAVPSRTPSASVASRAPELEPKAFSSSSEAARGDTRSGLGDSRGGPGARTLSDPFRTTSPVPDEPKIEERATAAAPEPVPSLPPARPAPAAPPVAPEPRVPEARLHGSRRRESSREQHREAGLSRRGPTGRLVVAAVGGVDRRPA